MSHNLRGRLSRLEQRSDSQPTDVQVDRVLSLVERLETTAGRTLAEVFRDPWGPGADNPAVAELVALLTASPDSLKETR